MNLRPIKVSRNYQIHPEGSCLFQMGRTKVICAASVLEEVPDHAKEAGAGWVTAEYSMLPRATTTRSNRGRISSGGRAKEISRLIGRALRAGVDLASMPGLSVVLDCDVLQADGGTRTASINGAFVAMVQALRRWRKTRGLPAWPVRDYIGAVSVGIIDGKPALDLDYEKDRRTDVDLNVVMTGSGRYVEIQGNAERKPFAHVELEKLLRLAGQGIRRIIDVQKGLLGEVRSA